jgi:hypothetical protein
MLGWQGLRHLVGRVQSIAHLPESLWRKTLVILATTTVGCAGGIFLHPNAKNLFQFLWVQVVVIGVQTPFDRVRLGEEWRSITVGQLLVSIRCLSCLRVMLVAFRGRREKRQRRYQNNTTKTSWPKNISAPRHDFLGLLTLKSKAVWRIFIPTLEPCLKPSSVSTGSIYVLLGKQWGDGRVFAIIAVAALLPFSAGVDLKDTFRVSIRTTFLYVRRRADEGDYRSATPERLSSAVGFISASVCGQRSVTAYVSGMDPTYLFCRSTHSNVRRFVFDQAVAQTSMHLPRESGGNYIIFERERKQLEDRLKIDERFTLVSRRRSRCTS